MNKYQVYFRGDEYDTGYQAWRENVAMGSVTVEASTKRDAIRIAKRKHSVEGRVANLKAVNVNRVW